jgi:peptidoglycan/LPS O-acetylase OafA/YrhL
LPVLDALRMVAALWVFLFHATFAENYFVTGDTTPLEDDPSAWGVEIVRSGWLGVDVFFVISGIVITRTAVGRTAPEFLVARFARIVPSFLAGVTIAVLVTFLLGGEGTAPDNGHAPLSDLLPSLTLLNFPLGDSVPAEPSYWTLWVEVKFYALMAACLFVCRIGSRRSIVVFLAFWTLAVAVAHQAGPSSLDELDALLLVWFAPYFILGAALGLIRSRREFVVLAPLVVVSLTLAAHTAEARGAFVTWTSTACVLVALVLVVTGLLIPGSDSRLSRYATALGLASFPLYLLNLRFGGLVVGALESRGVAVPVAVGTGAVTLLVLACLWAIRVEPRLQRGLRAALTHGLRELSEPEPRPPGGGGVAPAPRLRQGADVSRETPADEPALVTSAAAPRPGASGAGTSV